MRYRLGARLCLNFKNLPRWNLRVIAVWYALGALALLIVVAVVVAIVSPRLFVRGLVRPCLEVLYRKQIHNPENLPSEGGYVIVSNHISWIDGILLLWLMPRNVRFVVDGANFNGRIATLSCQSVRHHSDDVQSEIDRQGAQDSQTRTD